MTELRAQLKEPCRAAELDRDTTCGSKPEPKSHRTDSGPLSHLIQCANALPILDIAKHLGIKVRNLGRTPAAHCLTNGSSDKNPSLRFYPDTNTWTCFSAGCPNCNRRSDVIQLVEVKRGRGFSEATGWLREHYKIPSPVSTLSDDPLALWAYKRGVVPESARQYAEADGAEYVVFPMRWSPWCKHVGRQKRCANNDCISRDGKRSICGKGDEKALFFPKDWREPGKDAVVVVSEGEADAVAGHSVGFEWTVGAPAPPWNEKVLDALSTYAGPAEHRIIIPDGNIPDWPVYEAASAIQADVVRVPITVAAEPGKRDLNEWLVRQGHEAIQAAIKREIEGASGYSPRLNTAMEDIMTAVELHCGPLQKRLRAPLYAIASYLLENIRVFGERTTLRQGKVKVGPGQWVTNYRTLMKLTGSTQKTVRNCLGKLKQAGILDWKNLGGKRGIAVTIYAPSCFLKTARRGFERFRDQSMLTVA